MLYSVAFTLIALVIIYIKSALDYQGGINTALLTLIGYGAVILATITWMEVYYGF